MSRRLSLLAAAAAAALAIALPQAGSAQDACSTSAQQRQCSIECCGRRVHAVLSGHLRQGLHRRLPGAREAGAYRAQLGR